ncbi:hypothetical protein BHM03_00004717 [Ensete ventricosum]|uniref:Uncharacterized protein n=1 Tax=Ensete ventricosum TaxID=4639 RepID=A0A445MAT2_ENSVE|nr:hypothetical protein BHM03_00004717 [Ensete ventricosum]
MPEGRSLRQWEKRPREKSPFTTARSSFSKEKEKLPSPAPIVVTSAREQAIGKSIITLNSCPFSLNVPLQ